MIIQLEWLKEYVDFELSTEELGHLLSMSGLEVEAIQQVELANGRSTEIMELNVTPNRGYCLSYLGIAREVSGLLGKPFCPPIPDLPNHSEKPLKELLKVSINEPDLCPRYSAILIKNVKPAKSPGWLQDRLQAIGLRPINNIIDITNFVLMEYGQPLHAFDYDRLSDQTILVRRAKEGELFSSLNGKSLILNSEALVIADVEKPVALAGIVGGANSEITDFTKNVVLESAYFDPISVRKTSRKYAIRTDSSYRFERGVDIEGIVFAQKRAAQLIMDLAKGHLFEGRIDLYPKKRKCKSIPLRVSRIQKILGKELLRDEINNLLIRLGMRSQSTPEGFDVEVPSFRPNLNREIDLIEEIARIKGFGLFSPASPIAEMSAVSKTRKEITVSGVLEAMRFNGYSEVINFSFVENSEADLFKPIYGSKSAQGIRIHNPLSAEMSTMRTSLLPGLLKTASRNIRKGQKSIKLFELANVFYLERNDDRKEVTSLAGLIHGVYENSIWKQQGKNYDFYDLKGMINFLASRFKFKFKLSPIKNNILKSEKSMECLVGDDRIGFMGELSNEICRQFDLPTAIYVFEIDFNKFISHFPRVISFSPIPKYPESYRDLSIIIDKSVLSGTVIRIIRDSGGPNLNRVELYDQFEGNKLDEGKKSLTFALTFQSSDKTLTDEEVNSLYERIIGILYEKLGAMLRDG